jgi:DNA polymerase III subunit tau-like protein
VTRPAADLSRESVAFRLERLEQGAAPIPPSPVQPSDQSSLAEESAPTPAEPAAPSLELTQLQEAWSRTVIPAVEERGGIPTASLLREAHPADLHGDTLTLEFPPTAQFHLDLVRDPKNATLLADALYDVTGRRLEVAFELGEAREIAVAVEDEPANEEDFVQQFTEQFDAHEREP